ncbi:MAG: hypothetical protein LBT39_07250 [Treponema sp.]|nr:hypothetical protein [Treponema sp.]
MDIDSPEPRHINAEKSLALASALFPGEEWVLKEPGIWVGKSRLRLASRERLKLAWEMEHARILIQRGSVAYFLPELENTGMLGVLSADTVINGEIVEIKAVAGTRATLGHEFRKGYKQGAYLVKRHPEISSHSVFIRLFSDLPVLSVKAKIAGELKSRTGSGSFICYFEYTGKLYTWTYEELRSIIRREPPV